MAEIFLALRLGPGPIEQLAVIKRILSQYNDDREFVRLFYREAGLSCRLQHTNVISTWSCEVIEGCHCMVMEYLRGVTVDDMQLRAAELGIEIPVEIVVWIILCACEGLHYLHTLKDGDGRSLEIVHRDVSPQNIFLCFNGIVKLFDFGIAQMRFEENESDPHEGMLAGKYAYMSPEQARGEKLDLTGDIFSAGTVLYELSTGHKLFERSNNILILDALTKEEIKTPSMVKNHFPGFLERVIMRALEREPKERYASALDFADDLRKFLKISGFRPTEHSLSDFLLSLFAPEIAKNDVFLVEAIRKARETFPPEDPSECSENTGIYEDNYEDEYISEGVGVEEIPTNSSLKPPSYYSLQAVRRPESNQIAEEANIPKPKQRALSPILWISVIVVLLVALVCILSL